MAKKPKKNDGKGSFVGNALRFLVKSGKTVAPAILDLAGNITGVKDLEKIGDLIRGETALDPVDKEYLLKELEYDLLQEKERTERWKADMSSDSWMSKNARPIALFNMLLIFDILMISALFDRELMEDLTRTIVPLAVPESYVTLFMSAFLTVLNGYFVLRTIEKRNEKKYR